MKFDNIISSGSTNNINMELNEEQRNLLNMEINIVIDPTPSNQSDSSLITKDSSKTWSEIKNLIST